MKCPKCEQAMELGVVGDAAGGAPSLLGQTDIRAPVWYSGAIDGSLFVATDGRNAIYVQTMRCKGCGYLESYAVEPPSTA